MDTNMAVSTSGDCNWELWKVLIYTKYIYEEKDLAETAAELDSLGFQVTSTSTISFEDISRLEERLIPSILAKLASKSLAVMFGSDEMAMHLFVSQSVDCMASRFDVFLPQGFEGENLLRASALVGDDLHEIQLEILKLLIYFFSNCLIGHSFYSQVSMSATASELLNLLQVAGLTSEHIIRSLVNVSTKSTTLMATIRAVFVVAVSLGDVGLVATLLRCDQRIKLDEKIAAVFTGVRWGIALLHSLETPLRVAVARGYIEMVKLLLEYGSEIDFGLDCVKSIFPTLTIAILETPLDKSKDMVQLLLTRGAAVNGLDGLQPLQAAAIMGNVCLIDQLVGAGADIGYKWKLTKHIHGIGIRFYEILDHLESVTALGLAAGFCTTPATSDEDINHGVRFFNDQEQALALCVAVFSRRCMHAGQTDQVQTTDAVIIAAARGYSDVVAYLHNELCADIAAANGLLNPIYAAVASQKTQTCRQLLEFGASVETATLADTNGTCAAAYPSLLHIAAVGSSRDIIELLLQYGASVIEIRQYDLVEKSTGTPMVHGPPFGESLLWPPERYHVSTRLCVSPFRLAIHAQNWENLDLLMASDSDVTAQDLFEATERGHLCFVKKLLSLGFCQRLPIGDIVQAYQAALSLGHVAIASCLAASGVMVTLSTEHICPYPVEQGDMDILSGHLLCASLEIRRDYLGRSYLENSLLSGNLEVITCTLSSHPGSYDSGALLAAVHIAGQSTLPEMDSFAILDSLVTRRNTTALENINASLENAAVSLAALGGRLNILSVILRGYPPTAIDSSSASITVKEISKRLNTPPMLLENPSAGLVPSKSSQNEERNWYDIKHIQIAPSLSASISPLKSAILGDNEHIIETLLDAGFQADITTLTIISQKDLPSGLVERIVKASNYLEAEYPKFPPFDCFTPLRNAVRSYRIDIAKCLLAYGTHAGRRLRENLMLEAYVALMDAVTMREMSFVDILLHNGVCVNEPTWSPRMIVTPLQLAAEGGSIGILQRLIEGGADMNARRALKGGDTALEAAARNGHLDSVQFLLHSGVETEGRGRVQYLLSIYKAKIAGHAAVEMLLRSHRQWTQEDQVEWGRLGEFLWTMEHFLHPAEFSLYEFVNIIASLDEHMLQLPWHRVFLPQQWHIQVSRLILVWASKMITVNPHFSQQLLVVDLIHVTLQAIWKHEQQIELMELKKRWGYDNTIVVRAMDRCYEKIDNWRARDPVHWFPLLRTGKSCRDAPQIALESLRQWTAQNVTAKECADIDPWFSIFEDHFPSMEAESLPRMEPRLNMALDLPIIAYEECHAHNGILNETFFTLLPSEGRDEVSFEVI
ncbi:2-5A-dependent ribonuclease [Paramyrothecium foliicola]|nr:2-5A-dependent ribonuclease [Paramyrothecium foliicola]